MAGRISSPVFIGRTAELGRLGAAIQRAAAGEASAVLVAGEAGIGKSRLVREAALAAAAAGSRVLTGGCLPLADDPIPFAPIIEALRPLPATLGQGVVEDLVGEWRDELATLLPALGRSAEAAGLTGDARARLFEFTLAFLGRRAAAEPILLVVEDLHWADRSTIDLLAFLVRNARATRLAILGTYRTGEVDREHSLVEVLAVLEASGRLERLDLRPLDRGEVAAQVRAIVTADARGTFVDRVADRSEGNPFFVEELLAVDVGDLSRSLRDLLLLRLASSSEPTRDLLRVAAVGGLRVSSRVVAAVLGTPEIDVRPGFREAVDREILVPDPDGSPGRYAFRHALTQEAILSGILADERVQLHAAFAAVLDELSGDGPNGRREPGVASELAYHWSSAHDDLRAYSAHIEAGLAAEAIAAYPEAERHLRQAVEIHDRRPADRLPPGVDLVDILRRMARCASLGGAPSRAVESQQRAIELVDPVADPTLAGVLRATQARYVSQVAPAPEVLELARDAVRLVPDEPPSDARAFVLAVLAGSLVVMAHYEEALDVSELAIVAARRAGNAVAEVGVLLSRTVAMGFFAETDDALAAAAQALEMALRVGDPAQIGRAYWNLGYMQAMTGRRWADAIATCLEGVAASERNGLLFENGGGRDLLGSAAYSAWASGRWALADELLDRARDLGAEESETTLGFLYADVRALLALARGELDAAARWIDELRRITGDDNADPAVVSELGRVPAQLALDRGRPEEASEIVRRTISSLDAIGATLDADDIGETLAVGTRVEADVAMAARARRDPVAVDTALARARGYVERLRTLHGDFARTRPGRARVSAAFLRSAEAELARLTREPADWPGVADRWTDLDEPLRVAYAWFRDAEAILATSRRRMAAEASLRRAREIAERLGAIVLLREIDVLAGRGGIPEIGERPDPTAGNGTGAASMGSRFGLTKREREVLALLADGRTNREIGERLFITEKSAGVHVSNILGKVGAARRTEAVAIARRAGIV